MVHNNRKMFPARMSRLSDHIRLLAMAVDKPSPQEALDLLVKTPGWEQKVKEWYRNEKQAGLGKGLAVPLSIAILTLFQTTGAQTAEEFISQVKNRKVTEKVAPAESFTKQDLNRMEGYIPYPLNKVQIGALKKGEIKIPLTKKTLRMSLPYFEEQIDKEIAKGMKNDVLPSVRTDPRFKGLSRQKLGDLIVQATFQKIENPKHEEGKEALMAFLSMHNKTLEYAKAVIEKSVFQSMHSHGGATENELG